MRVRECRCGDSDGRLPACCHLYLDAISEDGLSTKGGRVVAGSLTFTRGWLYAFRCCCGWTSGAHVENYGLANGAMLAHRDAEPSDLLELLALQ